MSHLILAAPPVKPWAIVQEGVPSQAASGTLTANQVYLWTFETQAPITITGMRYKMGATVTGTVDLGIYDANGNLLAHTGAVATVASLTTLLNFGSALNLAPGRYIMALCPSNATDTYFRLTTAGAGLARSMGCVNTGTAGVLPATTGAFSTAGSAPVMEAVVSGGAP